MGRWGGCISRVLSIACRPVRSRTQSVRSRLGDGGLFPATFFADGVDGFFHGQFEIVLHGVGFAKGFADLEHAGDGVGGPGDGVQVVEALVEGGEFGGLLGDAAHADTQQFDLVVEVGFAVEVADFANFEAAGIEAVFSFVLWGGWLLL
jgi:hypothetical protein